MASSTSTTTTAGTTSTPPQRRRSSHTSTTTVPKPSASSSSSSTSLASTSSSSDYILPAPTSSTWNSLPLAFAVLPCFGGLLWDDGSAFVADVMLLLLLSIFLHWLIKFPWEWYYSSQLPSAIPGDAPCPVDPARAAATREMRRYELAALACCFLGPILGGALLHAMRAQLSRPSEGLVSNFNLAVFVLAAELRPVAQVVRLMRGRVLFLHRTVAAAPPPLGRVAELERRIEEMGGVVKELRALARSTGERDPEMDALNRAVRRYEKKEALHSAQTEARIKDINCRLDDVITLAAAASARQQREQRSAGTTLATLLTEWLLGMLLVPFELAWTVVCLPKRAVAGLGIAAKRGGAAVGGRGAGRLKEW